MLRGWRAQQAARGLRDDTIVNGERSVRRFLELANEYPWNWSASHVDEWSLWLTSEKRLAASTVRSYQGSPRLFTEFLIDARYGWAAEREARLGTHPVQICHEWNTMSCAAVWNCSWPRRSSGLATPGCCGNARR